MQSRADTADSSDIDWPLGSLAGTLDQHAGDGGNVDLELDLLSLDDVEAFSSTSPPRIPLHARRLSASLAAGSGSRSGMATPPNQALAATASLNLTPEPGPGTGLISGGQVLDDDDFQFDVATRSKSQRSFSSPRPSPIPMASASQNRPPGPLLLLLNDLDRDVGRATSAGPGAAAEDASTQKLEHAHAVSPLALSRLHSQPRVRARPPLQPRAQGSGLGLQQPFDLRMSAAAAAGAGQVLEQENVAQESARRQHVDGADELSAPLLQPSDSFSCDSANAIGLSHDSSTAGAAASSSRSRMQQLTTAPDAAANAAAWFGASPVRVRVRSRESPSRSGRASTDRGAAPIPSAASSPSSSVNRAAAAASMSIPPGSGLGYNASVLQARVGHRDSRGQLLRTLESNSYSREAATAAGEEEELLESTSLLRPYETAQPATPTASMHDEPQQASHDEYRERGAVSLGRILLLAACLLGVEFVWAIQVTFTVPIFLQLGLSPFFSSAVWLAGPISGLVVQPLVGAFSDQCTARMGRRRPYVLGGLIVSLVGLVAVSNAADLGHLVGPGAGPALGILIAAIGTCFLVAAINAMQGPCRALATDLTAPSQSLVVSAAFTFLSGTGEEPSGGAPAARLCRCVFLPN